MLSATDTGCHGQTFTPLQGRKLGLTESPPFPPPHVSGVALDGGEALSWGFEHPGQQTGLRGDFTHGGGQRERGQTRPGF